MPYDVRRDFVGYGAHPPEEREGILEPNAQWTRSPY